MYLMPNFCEGVTAAEEHFDVPIMLLRVGFKNDQLVRFDQLDELLDIDGRHDWLYAGRLEKTTDGHTVNKLEHGVMGRSVRILRVADVGYAPVPRGSYRGAAMAFLNADCPALFLLDCDFKSGQPIGCWFAHAGLECLLPKDPAGVSVIDTIADRRQEMGHRGRVIPFVGGGAEACCYAASSDDHLADIRKRIEARYHDDGDPMCIISDGGAPTTRGSRKGRPAISLANLCRRELHRRRDVLYVPSFHHFDTCTCCLGDTNDDGHGAAWSHMWHGGGTGANANPRNFTAFAYINNE